MTCTGGGCRQQKKGAELTNEEYTAVYVEQPPIGYVDEKGNPLTLTLPYTVIDENTVGMGSSNTETWYVVKTSVTNNNRLSTNGKVNILLCDGATFTNPKGITVNRGRELTIWQQENGTGKLEIHGVPNFNAAIGGADNSCGKITINGGVINVKGGIGGAGIGSGGYYSCTTDVITINAGRISADGGSNSAGIGGSIWSGARIVINGGTINAKGMYQAAAIGNGGGSTQSSGEDGRVIITINGGTIKARGGTDSASIGTGNAGFTGKVTINGGNINTDPSAPYNRCVGIGAGKGAGAMEVILNFTDDTKAGMRVYAQSYSGTVKILNYFKDQKGTLYEPTDLANNAKLGGKTLVPSDFIPVDYIDADGSAKRLYDDYTVIDENTVNMGTANTKTWYVLKDEVINNNYIKAKGDVNIILCDGAKLTDPRGIAVYENEGNLTIYGQTEGTGELYIEKVAGYGGYAAIGGMQDKNSGVITINGGTITAYGEYSSAGIGGSIRSDGTVIINGGTINAKGGARFAAIGGGHQGNGYVTINGGNINADGKIGGSGTGTGTISLSWKNPTDSIKATQYQGDVTLQKYFINEDETVYEPAESFDVSLIAGKTLTPYDGKDEQLVGYTLSLNGDIGVNFYMELRDSIANSDTAYMHFTIPTGSSTSEQKIFVKDARQVKSGAKTYYVFECQVAAKEMTSQIKAQIIDGENLGTEYTYSVRDYANYLLAHAAEREDWTKAVPLVKAMLNYGAYSQLNFDKNPTDLANTGLTEKERTLGDVSIDIADPITDNLPEGTTFEGATLSLKSETTLSLYFKSNTDLEFSCNGYTVEKATSGGYQIARIRGIKAKHIGDVFRLNVNGTTVTYSPLNYCKNILTPSAATADEAQSQDEKLVNVVKALYLYWQAADSYFD